MIRVGFVLSFHEQAWTGGVNYFKNLIMAIVNQASPRIQPVIFTNSDAPNSVEIQFPGVEIVRSNRVSTLSWRWKFGKLSQRLLGRDAEIENFFRKHRIDVLSHSGHLGPKSRLPTIGWIPDFQHIRMPEFFSAAERSARDARFIRLCSWCTLVIVSSYDAKNDLRKFMPAAEQKCRVLQFVSGLNHDGPAVCKLSELESKFGFSGAYFHVPNQFWMHKNHIVVIKALAELRRRGEYVQVLATGNPKDLRQADYFNKLMQDAENFGVLDMFKVLGMVPYHDLCSIMHYSVAVINPSHFEGWSTTVEEAKSAGKRVIISDIPVHREQDPPRAIFFDKDCEGDLADALINLSRYSKIDFTNDCDGFVDISLDVRLKKFVNEYENIVIDSVG